MKYKYNIKNLDCANCAKTIENKLNEDKNIKKAIVNFNSSTVTVETDLKDAFTYIKKIVTFVGTSKNGTSFIVNNLAELISSTGINVAILDTTKVIIKKVYNYSISF